MTPNEIAAQFSDDARALRARADQLAAAPRRGAGPSAEECRSMATACDQVAALSAVAGSDAASVAELRRALEQRLSTERAPQVRHVYAGAIERLTDDEEDFGDDDEDMDDDEDLDDVDDGLDDEDGADGTR